MVVEEGWSAGAVRRVWTGLACALGALGLAGCSGAPGPADARPNVLLVVIDTLRADHLGAYGYAHDTSPRLDALAAEGVLLERCFSTSSWTRPGMASLFTGEHPRTVGIYREKYDRLPDRAVTLAERLSAAGYRTLSVNSNPNLNEVFGFAQGFDAHLDAGVVWQWMESAAESSVFNYRDDNLDDARTITERALAALDGAAASKRAAPFYLRVVYIDPHVPYAPPPEHQRAVAAAGSRLPDYDGEIRFADAQVGRLLDGLRDRELLADTLVVVTSDHGEGLATHMQVPDSRGHGTTLYDATTHIPMILRLPGSTPEDAGGRRIEALVSSTHLVPTILELVGLDASGLPSISLAPLITGSASSLDLPTAVVSETEWRRNRKLSVRTDEHRLVRNDDCLAFQSEGVFRGRKLSAEQRRALGQVPPVELYRIGPGGELGVLQDNLAETAAQAQPLAEWLVAWEREVPRAAPLNRATDEVLTLGDGRIVPVPPAGGDSSDTGTTGPATLDPETTERLKALGYLE